MTSLVYWYCGEFSRGCKRERAYYFFAYVYVIFLLFSTLLSSSLMASFVGASLVQSELEFEQSIVTKAQVVMTDLPKRCRY